uniref:Uncharacterized protein n=1 Tax=Arcella intermedia TaxID=1963864 RepID=A0A6B2LF90_9EUKA
MRGGLVCVGVALGSLASQWVPVKAAVKGDYELVQVQVIARHGARTPILSARTPQTLLNLPWTCEPYEKENPYLVIEKNNFVVPYDEYKVVTLHSYGKKPTFGGSCVDGQLTLKGMEQATQLGALLRQRYIVNTPFLPEKYGGDSVYFRSSSTSRTILTARNIVNGLYPLNFRAKEDKVVVHIKADENLYGRSACRNFLELKKLQRSGPKHQSLSQQIKQISEKVTEDTAYWGTRSICGYANDLSALVDHGFPLPKGISFN